MTALAEFLPAEVGRVLDLGTGDGVTLALVRELRPGTTGVAADFSAEMLALARERFAGDDVEVVAHDLTEPLPAAWGTFDLVVSSFAIHHVPDARKRGALRRDPRPAAPGRDVPQPRARRVGDAGAPRRLPRRARASTPPTTTRRTSWRRSRSSSGGCGAWDSRSVDCHWKWRELALLGAVRP